MRNYSAKNVFMIIDWLKASNVTVLFAVVSEMMIQ